MINPFPLASSADMLRLTVLANMVLSSGDITFSDALSIGKIPLPQISKKETLFHSLRDSLLEQLGEDEQKKELVDTWIFAAENLDDLEDFDNSQDELLKLEGLRSENWRSLQREYHAYLKKHFNLDAFISETAQAGLQQEARQRSDWRQTKKNQLPTGPVAGLWQWMLGNTHCFMPTLNTQGVDAVRFLPPYIY